MAKWQRTETESLEKLAEFAVGQALFNAGVFTGQTRVPRAVIDEIVRKGAAPLGDSEDYMIVAPSGKFYRCPGISQPGGTDEERP